MKIEPRPGFAYIKTEAQKVGAFDTSMRDSAVEYAEVVAVGDMVGLSVGDKIFVKAWGIDLVDFDGVRYEFVNVETGAILCKVNG